MHVLCNDAICFLICHIQSPLRLEKATSFKNNGERRRTNGRKISSRPRLTCTELRQAVFSDRTLLTGHFRYIKIQLDSEA